MIVDLKGFFKEFDIGSRKYSNFESRLLRLGLAPLATHSLRPQTATMPIFTSSPLHSILDYRSTYAWRPKALQSLSYLFLTFFLLDLPAIQTGGTWHHHWHKYSNPDPCFGTLIVDRTCLAEMMLPWDVASLFMDREFWSSRQLWISYIQYHG